MSTPAWRSSFLDSLGFPPDPFQLEAFDAVDAGRSVLVSAPTGAGKTLVADYAVEHLVRSGEKAFYTTPLKALSNQKRAELARRFGPERVGLLTGDISLRAEADVVVMTTEVLRNMLLTGSPLLARLGVVVLDEVHFLQDPYRGGVWEEVIVLAPPHVAFVCLSATVANAGELGDWLRSVRGPTAVVTASERPVELEHHFALSRRGEDRPSIEPLLRDGSLSSPAAAVDERARRAARAAGAGGGPQRSPHTGRRHGPPRPSPPFRTPRRVDLVEELEAASLLPAIVFIFSRAACDDAARQTAEAGIRFTTRAERARLRAVAERRVDELTDAELDVLGYHAWVSGLEAGVAAHHAGMVPAFRETVEEAFAAGLLRVVYATETLSLGINMPARTVVLERFSKWGPAGRADLTSGDYLQLTGRAGRRGLDRQGHAVVLWSPGLELARVAAVATGRPPALRSAFRPTYNLAANLVRRFDRPRALDVLRRSFGQWQATHLSGGSPEHLTQLFSRRLSVLEELGFLRGWSLTRLGERLSRIYHEADIVVAQLLEEGHLGSDPAVLAGLLSALVYEPRRDRRPAGRRAGRPAGGRRGGAPARSRRRKGSDRLGERRLQELGQRAAELRRVVEVTRAVEEVHRVPPVRRPAPELGPAVATWVRGGTLGEVLDAAGRSGVELAPGDFVRMAKQLGDLLGQVAVVGADGGDPGAAGAASAAFPLLVRGVVAASGTAAGGEVEEAPETVEPGPEASTTRSRARS